MKAKTIQHHIGGQLTAGGSTRTAPVWDPATGRQQAEVLVAEPRDVALAVATARAAFGHWGNVSVTRRARVMSAFRDLVNEHLDELARIVAGEHGTKFVYDFSEGSRGMRVLRGRKRANVAERARVPGTERVPEPIARMAAAHAAIRSWASIELPDKLARQKEAAWV